MSWSIDTSLSVGSLSNNASRNKSIVRGLAYHRRVYKTLEAWQKVNVPEQELKIEPWLRHRSGKCLQPDAVLIDPVTITAIVIEVKLNWKDGRDEKLIKQYLGAAKAAFNLELVWPALITSNVAGLSYKPRLGLSHLLDCADWTPGAATPVVLLP